MVPSRRHRLPAALGALLAFAALAVGASGCAPAAADRLLVAEAPRQGEGGPTVRMWAVDPGEEPGDDNLVSDGIANPGVIETRTEEGTSWMNRPGREWNGSLLLTYSDGQQSRLTLGDPGGEQATAAESPQMQATVVRRGVLTRTGEGCVLVRGRDQVRRIGQGTCVLTSDERWALSFLRSGEGDPGGLVIRDLRNDTVVERDDLSVIGAAGGSNGRRVLVVTVTEEGAEAIVMDPSDGREVGRTGTYPQMDAGSILDGPDGFVVLAADEDGSQRLLHVDHDGRTETIEAGAVLVPVANHHEVTYLRYPLDPAQLGESALRRWSPDHGAETLLEGYVGAGPVGEDHVLATRETDQGVEFWREDGARGFVRALTLERSESGASPQAGGSGIRVPTALVKGHTVLMRVEDDSGTSLVRIDMEGDHSDAPVVGAASLSLDAVDSDGTVLLTRTAGADGSGEQEIMVLGPHADRPDVRATVGLTGRKLIHEGRIYFTDVSNPERVSVQEVRSSGSDRTVRELYSGMQIAGATWPEEGGATRAFLVTPLLLLQPPAQPGQ
jgi:hypothetical protein